MSSFVLGFQDIDKSKHMMAGGKGANLGELSRIEGIPVPAGFCITTEAFKKIMEEMPSINELLHQLSFLKSDDRDWINELSAAIRKGIEAITIPAGINSAITQQLNRLGKNNAYAIRSSATAEDLPSDSFAGQQDKY